MAKPVQRIGMTLPSLPVRHVKNQQVVRVRHGFRLAVPAISKFQMIRGTWVSENDAVEPVMISESR